MSYPKFKDLDVVWDLPVGCGEWDHIVTVLQQLEGHLVPLHFSDRFIFLITSQSEIPNIAHDLPAVVYQINDRAHSIPCNFNDVFMLFKNYVPLETAPINVCSLPIGCNKNIPDLDVKLMIDRNIDLFFMGRMDNREDFRATMNKEFLSEIEADNIMIEKSEEMQYHDYAYNLSQAKLALCPGGLSNDTFRIYEAMRSGCIVIVPRQLPAWYNSGWPIIELDDWSELKLIANSLLNDLGKLQELSVQTRLWWENKCSEEAVARYIAYELSLKVMRNSI